MNILYGIQGTGQGHISRAKELLPELCKYASVDVLISGYACQLEPGSDITYRKRGVSLKYNNYGGVAVLETLRQFKPIRFLNDIQSIPLQKYDLVISDYEPVSSWAARMAGVCSIALSHQAAFLSQKTPRPGKTSVVAEQLLQRFAPTDKAVAFHFSRYDDFIEPPIIREEIQQLHPVDGGHIVVYLPAYHSVGLAKMFERFPEVEWHIFSPSCYKSQQLDNIWLRPISQNAFLKSLETCSGVISSAGFEMCSEVMYLGKRLLVVPIENQYEQLCNAVALKRMGVKVLPSLRNQKTAFWDWLKGDDIIHLNSIADPAEIVKKMLNNESFLTL